MPTNLKSTLARQVTYANVASTLALVVALGTGTAYAANTIHSSDIVNGQVKTADLDANAVTSAKLKNGDVGAPELGSNSVNSAKVLNATLTIDDLAANSVGPNQITTDAVDATEIADNSIDTGEIIDNSLFSSDLATGSVGTSEITDGTVSGADVATGALTGSDVANNSLTTADIAGADVNGGTIDIAAGAVPQGRCVPIDSSIGGARAGEAVVYSIQGAVQSGILFYGSRVVSDGHVTVNVCNFSGAPQVAINNLPVRVITFG